MYDSWFREPKTVAAPIGTKSGNKDGNRYLRAAFGQAAVSAYTHYKVVKKFYRKIKRRSGRPVTRAVVAKELAKGVWHMLTKKPTKDLRGSQYGQPPGPAGPNR